MGKYQKNSYGLDSNRPVFPQILRILHIGSCTETAYSLKRNLAKVSAKHFDVSDVPSIQKDAIIRIENELRLRYPEIYGGSREASEKRMYYAVRVAMDLHNQRRRPDREHHRKKPPCGQDEIKKTVTYGRVQPQSGFSNAKMAHVAPPRPTRPSNTVTMIDLTNDIDDSDIESDKLPLMELSLRSIQEPDSKVAVHKAIKKLELESASIPTRGRSEVGQKHKEFIHRFLACCDPPMVKYGQAFKDFNLATESYLRPLAKWGPMSVRRKDLVRQILAKDGTPVSELDVAFLDNHICDYFGEAHVSTLS